MLLSGIMFPVQNMPPALIVVAYLNPLKYFVTLMRNILLKGGDPTVMAVNLVAMALLALGAVLLAGKRFRQKLN
jgi:ABC-2 type transport system permease protein